MEILAPPPTDPMVRSEPPFVWGRAVTQVPQRDPRAVAVPVPDLDPDIALWRAIIVNIWPFTGAPATGEWPKGWFGIDSGGTPYVCTVGGEPGTWVQLATGSGEGWPTIDGAGPGNLTAETDTDDTVGYNLTDQGSGGITIKQMGTSGIFLQTQGDGTSGIELTTLTGDTGGVSLTDNGTSGILLNNAGTGPITFLGLPTSDPSIVGALWNNLGILTVSAG
jgi:hypothetical protein